MEHLTVIGHMVVDVLIAEKHKKYIWENIEIKKYARMVLIDSIGLFQSSGEDASSSSRTKPDNVSEQSHMGMLLYRCSASPQNYNVIWHNRKENKMRA